MPEHRNPSSAHVDAPTESPDSHDHECLRLLSRSPHPYQHRNLDRFSLDGNYPRSATSFPAVSREPTPTSDSGTEADDEHFLKGLPAPRTRAHKGLRGRNELLSGTSTPLPSPALLEEDPRRLSYTPSSLRKDSTPGKDARVLLDSSWRTKRTKEVVRRLTEVVILGSLGAVVQANEHVRPVLSKWRIELYVSLGSMASLVLLYPLRLVVWGYQRRSSSRKLPLSVPSAFDPAPLLYPPAITLLVASLISVDNEAILLPNIVLVLCSLPSSLFPAPFNNEVCNPVHWAISCVPLFLSGPAGLMQKASSSNNANSQQAVVTPETAILFYPLHRYFCQTLHTLTTTSLLPAELQLLSVTLINVLLLSSSPQATILKAMLWVGGLQILVLCSQVVKWGIALARVPKWRFRRAASQSKRNSSFLYTVMSWRRVRHDLFHAPMDTSSCSSCEAFDDPEDSDDIRSAPPKGHRLYKSGTFDGADSTGFEGSQMPGLDVAAQEARVSLAEAKTVFGHFRRHTLPAIENIPKKSHTHTPSGRKKRSASSSVRAFFSMTYEQATTRKWVYAFYIYACIFAAVFLPHKLAGVKEFVQYNALHGYEPVGWALGYLFGDLPWFRMEVLSRNLERWICLPSRLDEDHVEALQLGWVQYLRQVRFGEANTRLVLSAYFLFVIACGLLVVFRLSPIYEVDTRRKVFHFMMVAMFLPSIYIDPTFVGLALSIVLALFLLLDLLRASQLPPLSKPLAYFLAPYVDGRDLRGPVVVSHIFLLIGCAIPLWLSLASLPRTGTGFLEGWEVPTREVSMVSGVVCVGLGDAAASLIGRRYGHRKWLWGGGKSLEGSVAFALAVFAGLVAAQLWLRIGGWSSPGAGPDPWGVTFRKTGVCASMASLTEAVLTGGNDNVIVPVVLWTCVKSLGV
ncbi:uncharacterized protein BCR38DRAFT_418536 [Pseudomassariella vexata]|uniref:dolichol kinase n=1 Tax=Pseudomassariella vexata TaxID=1141098 RepID=A0A1Y2EKB3_9PEZI|nr:uncharacterized protein BCR38DRAFT_418536 [Pseudomassariella vexata]ORY71968.1 hypothetical protein BCR38DRAFT_418536 [Pseudomassariella vexata]